MNKPQERRRHQRVAVRILGRYMLEDKREFCCETIDMSPGGVALAAPTRGNIGERVIVYLDQIGRVEGSIIRHTAEGFALALNLPFMKREKIANQLTWLVNRDAFGLPEDRRHERIVPHRRHCNMRLDNGHEHLVKLIDISISGAAVNAGVQLQLGTKVLLGQTSGRVVRLFDSGFAVEFDRSVAIERFDENIKL
jgi:hypothetical protein